MKSIPREAIQKTLRYASFFNFELNHFETYLYLISSQTFPLPKKSTLLSASRLKSKEISQKIIDRSQAVITFLNKIPTIKMVALTGSLAMANAKRGDDFDLMIVTQKNTLWITRLLIYPFIRLFIKTPHFICLNLWLDESALKIPTSKQNLYTAHEVLQIKPLINRGYIYELFIKQNSWAKRHLANFYKHIQNESLKGGRQAGLTMKSVGGPSLYIIGILNFLAFIPQYLYMFPKITSESVNLHSAYFHPRNLASKLAHHLEKNP